MELTENLRGFLLKIINKNGNIEPFKEMGYEYYQIVQFINLEVQNQNAEHVNGKLVLTEQGKSFLKEIERKKKRSGSSQWIEPEYHSKIPKLNINDVYLPNQNDLWF
jgi:antibiotic biosynthesis monooxygenase (ABM) superfamily enzyme